MLVCVWEGMIKDYERQSLSDKACLSLMAFKIKFKLSKMFIFFLLIIQDDLFSFKL